MEVWDVWTWNGWFRGVGVSEEEKGEGRRLAYGIYVNVGRRLPWKRPNTPMHVAQRSNKQGVWKEGIG